MSMQLCLTGEIRVSHAERIYSSMQCPDIGNEDVIERQHFGKASQSWSSQAAFYELVSGLLTSFLSQTQIVL